MITLLFRGLVLLWCYFLTLTLSKKSTGVFVCEFQENLPGQRNQLSQSAQGWGYSRDTRLPMSGKAWENQDRSVTNPRLHLMILRNQLLYSWHLQNLCIRWMWTGQRTVAWRPESRSLTQSKSDNLWTSVHHLRNTDPNRCLPHRTNRLSRLRKLMLWRHLMHYKIVQK